MNMRKKWNYAGRAWPNTNGLVLAILIASLAGAAIGTYRLPRQGLEVGRAEIVARLMAGCTNGPSCANRSPGAAQAYRILSRHAAIWREACAAAEGVLQRVRNQYVRREAA
jgi:hypothetical protein